MFKNTFFVFAVIAFLFSAISCNGSDTRYTYEENPEEVRNRDYIRELPDTEVLTVMDPPVRFSIENFDGPFEFSLKFSVEEFGQMFVYVFPEDDEPESLWDYDAILYSEIIFSGAVPGIHHEAIENEDMPHWGHFYVVDEEYELYIRHRGENILEVFLIGPEGRIAYHQIEDPELEDMGYIAVVSYDFNFTEFTVIK